MAVHTTHMITCDGCGLEAVTATQGRRPPHWHGSWRVYNPTFGDDYCPKCSERMVKENMGDVPWPEIGQEVYVSSSFYIDHGEDDFVGGKAIINGIVMNPGCPNDMNQISVTIVERPGTQYNWKILWADQDKNKERYGDKIAHPDPDFG